MISTSVLMVSLITHPLTHVLHSSPLLEFSLSVRSRGSGDPGRHSPALPRALDSRLRGNQRIKHLHHSLFPRSSHSPLVPAEAGTQHAGISGARCTRLSP